MDNIYKTSLCLITVLLLSISMLYAEILNPAEQHQLVEMLNSNGFDSTDVNFLKDWDPTTKFKLPSQVDALNNPWKFITLLDELKQKSSNLSISMADSLKLQAIYYPFIFRDFSKYLDINYPRYNTLDEFAIGRSIMWSTVKRPGDLFKYVEFITADIDKKIISTADLSIEQRDSLSLWLYQAWQESEDSLAYKSFYNNQFPNIKTGLNSERAITLLEKVDWIELAIQMKDWESMLREMDDNLKQFTFTNKKPIYYKSRFGMMIIGSLGDDHYTDDKKLKDSPICFILDPGGNDVYDCSLFADSKHPYYIVIDLKGNDVYRNQGIAKGMSVMNGFGWVHDYEGDDVYQYGDFAQSAILGLHYLRDEKGNDTYSGGLFSQGAAMFGVSALIDNTGNDTYTATEFAQGMGGTRGLGMLIDGKGNDVYYTGGKYLHTPLAPFDYRSMGQGFGFGMRPDLAGGIGILYDGEGNDRYSGGVYAQGVAYWYAIGALFDEKGNDYYDAVYYPQGSGIHLANGALIDMEGEDHYYSKHGPGQGNGHDWSVGVFVDKKGNDEYSIEGGNGLGLTNSVGIFVDSEGNDSYEKKSTSNYGYANAARETAGLGLFLDGGGKDTYPDSTKTDNKTWQQGFYGIGQDMELNIAPQTKLEELAEQASADVDSLASIDKLFAMSSEWEVGSATEKVRLARKYLIKRDAEAVPYVLKTKMATDSGLEYRALEELTKQSKLMQSSLYAVLHDADSLKVKNAMALISGTKDSLAVDSISVFLKKNMYIPASLSCLGSYKTAKALDLIRPWLTHHTEKYRYLAARSLKAMNTPEAIAELRKMGNDSSFLIKAMVRQLPK